MFVHALVISHTDFSNTGVLYRVATVHFHPLQSVINAAVCIVLKLHKFDRVSIWRAIQNELHWLDTGQPTDLSINSVWWSTNANIS